MAGPGGWRGAVAITRPDTAAAACGNARPDPQEQEIGSGRSLRLCSGLRLNPELSVEAAVLNGFADILRQDLLGPFQVGDGAADLEDSIVGSRT